jgi:uncharacterized membrane protein (DUF485 family)
MSRNARLGLVLFFIYLALYGGFVLLNTFRAQLMELTPFGGVNLAVLYGFGLIVAALVLALIYGVLCRDEAAPESAARPNGETHR